jgi:predicted O-methyltransferase YrrM
MLPADCTLVTAELDPGLAAAAAGLLAPDTRIRVLAGDARVVLAPHAPFDLIFADSGVRRRTRRCATPTSSGICLPASTV